MKPETIQETMRQWEKDPEKAKGKPAVKAKGDGAHAVMEAGSFSWKADLPPGLGGTNQAPSPTALLLSALAGCAVVFIRDTLAPQAGVKVDAIEATAACETDARGLLGMSGASPDLANVKLDIQVSSPDPEDTVQQVFKTWQQRCPVYLALTKPMNVAAALTVLRR